MKKLIIVAEGLVKHRTIEPEIGKKEYYDIISDLWDEIMKAKGHKVKLTLEIEE